MDFEDHPDVRDLCAMRKVYHAALCNVWYERNLHSVQHYKHHADGSLCFGGDMFIVAAMLPTGLISNHYFTEDWNLFRYLKWKRQFLLMMGTDHRMSLQE